MSKEIAKKVIDNTIVKVKELKEFGNLIVPKNYHAETNLKYAGLILAETFTKDKKPVLQACTQESIANSLQKMVTDGLTPKKHCDFIAYGGKLSCRTNYQGAKMIAKRDAGVITIGSQVVYEGDDFSESVDLTTGWTKIEKHVKNHKSSDIVGCYAILRLKNEMVYAEFMTMDQIKSAWKMGGIKDSHKDFPDQMAKKTVERRACKNFIESLEDSRAFDEDEKISNIQQDSIKEQVEDAKNEAETIDFEEVKEEKEEIEEAEVIEDQEGDPF